MCIRDSFGDYYALVVGDEYYFKAAVVFVEFFGVVLTHYAQRGGKRVGVGPVLADDGGGEQSVFDGEAVGGVDYVRPAVAVAVHEVAEIAAGGDDGGVLTDVEQGEVCLLYTSRCV